MNIERLNKAATAAGFAMATPDDEGAAATPTEIEADGAQSRALVVPDQTSRLLSPDATSNISNWVKSYLTGFGWRQPA